MTPPLPVHGRLLFKFINSSIDGLHSKRSMISVRINVFLYKLKEKLLTVYRVHCRFSVQKNMKIG